MTLYCSIRHGMFPPNYKKVLYHYEDFGKQGDALYRLYSDHRDELRFYSRFLKEFLVEKFGGSWSKVKVLIRGPAVPAVSGSQAV